MLVVVDVVAGVAAVIREHCGIMILVIVVTVAGDGFGGHVFVVALIALLSCCCCCRCCRNCRQQQQ